jgi:hypothetical protein
MVWLGLLEMEQSLWQSVAILCLETYHASNWHTYNLMAHNLMAHNLSIGLHNLSRGEDGVTWTT